MGGHGHGEPHLLLLSNYWFFFTFSSFIVKITSSRTNNEIICITKHCSYIMTDSLNNLKFSSKINKITSSTCTFAKLDMNDFSLQVTIDGVNSTLTDQILVQSILDQATAWNKNLVESTPKFVVVMMLNPLNDIATHHIEA